MNAQPPLDPLAEALTAFERNYDGDEMVGGVPVRKIVEDSLLKLRQREFHGDALERATTIEQLRRAQEVWDVLNPREGMRKAA